MDENTITLLVFSAYFLIGLLIGFLWARFMPRWNMMDVRVHSEDCDKPFDDWSGQFLCRCPVDRAKTDDDRIKDFWCFFLMWPFALSLIAFWVATDLAASGCEWIAENYSNVFIKILGGTPDG